VKRLLAYVCLQPDAAKPDAPWVWSVEVTEPPDHDTVRVALNGRTWTALGAMGVCRAVAEREGFGLDWNGLVARGVPLDPSAQPSTEGT
jgi:hypothetical protein